MDDELMLFEKGGQDFSDGEFIVHHQDMSAQGWLPVTTDPKTRFFPLEGCQECLAVHYLSSLPRVAMPGVGIQDGTSPQPAKRWVHTEPQVYDSFNGSVSL